jgi:hypothetical protein
LLKSSFKRDPQVVDREIKAARIHLEFAAELCMAQHLAGGLFVFEQPASASSWKEPCLQRLAATDGVLWVTTDMCHHMNRKRTGLLVNSDALARA